MAPENDENRIKDWFMKNIILPNNEIIDKPGYVISQYVGAETPCYVREVFFPEVLLANIEKEFVKRFGREGKEALYKAGKLWGYRYAAITNLPKKSKIPKADFVGFLDMFMKFLESEY